MSGNTPYSLSDLLRVMERLRDPAGGCPWDLRQDFQSIVPSTLEECYELAQAIEDEDHDEVAAELGDGHIEFEIKKSQYTEQQIITQ